MVIVTGGAGFIGSALVWGLNQRGVSHVLIVDLISHDEQEHNLAPLQYEELINPDEFRENLNNGFYDDKNIEAIFHLGANSSTVGERSDYEDVNVVFSQDIIRWCVDRDVRCIYASSGATYGDGSRGYDDDHDLFNNLTPLNEYGKSKLNVDIWARDGGYLNEVVGLRYFNVFGPNEWHKDGSDRKGFDMRSVVAKKFDKLKSEGVIELFKSYTDNYEDGGQMRDFVYVKDAVEATLFFLDNRETSGVFNVGTGKARTWNDLAGAMSAALDKEIKIAYVDMPVELQGQYQDFTQADVSKLKAAGFNTAGMMELEDSVADYINSHLDPHTHLGE